MKILTKLLFILILPLGLWSSLLNAQYETMTPQGQLDELGILLEMTRETEAAINTNLVTKQTFASEKAQLDSEKANYDRDMNAYNVDLRRFNADIARYDADCARQLSEAEFDACEARADTLAPVKSVLDRRLQQLNVTKDAYNRKVAQWNQKESARAAEARQLLTQYDEIDANTKLLIGLLNAQEVFRRSNRSCVNSPSPAAMHQCFQRILSSTQ